MFRYKLAACDLLSVPRFLQVSRRFWKKDYPRFYARSPFFERLEETANSNPENADKQARFLEYLNEQKRFHDVIARVNSGNFAQNSKTQMEYIKAIQLQNQLQNPHLFQQQPVQQEATTTTSFYQQPPIFSTQQPYYQMPPPQLQQQQVSYEAPVGTEKRPLIIATKSSARSFVSDLIKLLIAGGVTLLMLSFLMGNFSFRSDSQAGGAGNNTNGSFVNKLLGNYSYEPIKDTKKSFQDIKGIDECMDEIKELVEFLKNPNKFEKMGAKLPKGVLLTGSPGVGKTLLAKAIAGEAGVPFFYVSGSEFDEVFVGLGAGRVRGLFESARKHAPCIIFIDEIDALGSKRKERDIMSGSKQTINQLLAEMDGFNPREGIIVVGATNLPDALDNALTRPGRFDKHVEVPLPDVKGREEILSLYAKGKPFNANVKWNVLANRSIGFSGADLENLVNEAAIRASIRNAKDITMDDMEHAFDRIVLGLEHKSIVLTDDDKRRTAIHEAGHAIIALLQDDKESKMVLHKVTITPRGRALGVTHSMPSPSKHTTKKELLHHIDKCLGGLVAEEVVYGTDNIATGASSDLQSATNVARAMVVQYGMSNLGMLDYSIDYSQNMSFQSFVSAETKREIDLEVRKIIQESYERVRAALAEHEGSLKKLASELLKKETLSGEEVSKLLNLKKKE